jgi:hypothetical protein
MINSQDCDSLPRAHRCSWNLIGTKYTPDYTMDVCRGCNRVTAFHWKSFWRRLLCVFINETKGQNLR